MLETTQNVRTTVAAGVIALGIASGAVLYDGKTFHPNNMDGTVTPAVYTATTKSQNINVDFVRLSYTNNDDGDEAKASFIKFMMPMIESVQKNIQQDRKEILELLEKRNPSEEDKQKLLAKMDEYNVDNGNVEELLKRVDVVPSSLILGQAAIESGWGKSPMTQKTKGLFGQKGNGGNCSVAANDGGKYPCFKSFNESIRSYVKNLNTHPAYSGFREMRYRLRVQGKDLDYNVLINGLGNYSTMKGTYIQNVRSLINDNRLYRFDRADFRS